LADHRRNSHALLFQWSEEIAGVLRECRSFVCRIEFGPFFQFLACGFIPAFLAVRNAEIIVRGGILGIDGQSLGEFIDRLVVFALAVVNDAQRAMGEAVVWGNRDGLPEILLG
jgi:hypothetical protein